MNIVVQKFGGTSVENKDKLENVCKKIIEYHEKNIKLVVVVSAQGKTTNELIQKANEYSSNPSKRELDILLATGELQTVALITMILKEKGYNAIGLSGEQAGILTDSTYGNAVIKSIYINNILNYLNENMIVVVAGFQGIDKFGNVTTIGRGGSDLTAVAIASALKARKCEIYTDVDGIFSSDPKIISKAKLLKKVSYDEMLEAATAGAKVLHNRSVSVSKKNNLKILVKNSQNKKAGSIVEQCSEDIEKNEIKFISKNDNVSKITIIGDLLISNKYISNKIFSIAEKLNLDIYMISFSEISISILVNTEKAEEFMSKLHEELIENKIIDKHILK